MSYTTLWEVPEGLWKQIEPILPPEKPLGSRGRPALPNRQVVNGILFVLRSGCQWKGLKKEWFGASSSLHARFQAWNEAGVWKKVYRRMMKYYHQKRHIQWRWQLHWAGTAQVPTPQIERNWARNAICGWISVGHRWRFTSRQPTSTIIWS